MKNRNSIKPVGSFIWALLLFHLPSLAQVNHYKQIDSLQQLLKGRKNDTAKAGLLTTLGQYYFPINTDSGFAYAQQALRLSKNLGWKKGEVLALKAIGSNYWEKAEYLKCQDYFLQARDIALELNDPAILSIAYHALAISYLPLGNTEKGIEYLQKALAIEQQLANPSRLMSIYHNLGDIYEGKQDYHKALSYYEKSLPAAINAKYGLGIAYTYLKMGTLNVALNALSEGFGYLQKSLSLARTLNEQPVVVLALIGSGEVYRKRHQYNRAVAYYDSALAVSATFKAIHYIGLHGTYLLSTADLYREKAQMEKKNGQNSQAFFDFRQAVALLKKGLQVSGSVPDWVTMRDEALLLSDIYQEWGKDKEALQAFKQYITYRDSVMNIEKAKQRAQHEMRVMYDDSLSYFKKLQEKHLYVLAQENKLNKYRVNQMWLVFAITVIAAALVATIFLHRDRLQKVQMKNELQQEKLQKQFRETELQHRLNDMTLTALHSQMNPHFIFNALNTIQSYVYSNDKKSASSYLGKFSELIRKILDNSSKQTITLEEEIELLQLYIDIEKARFGDTLYVVIEVDPDVDIEGVYIPPMLIQPYVENAIKHGLLHRTEEKQLFIFIRKSEDQDIEIVIEDNGIGRSKSIELNKTKLKHNSFANAANEKRIDLLYELFGKKAKLEIIDKINQDGTAAGTKVIITIPAVLFSTV
jgi:tetratricopeptide (TPR) repeat protein